MPTNHERKSKAKVLVTSAGEVIGAATLFRKRPPLPRAELGGGGAEPLREDVREKPKSPNGKLSDAGGKL